jgi:methionyl-tRNA synthetase
MSAIPKTFYVTTPIYYVNDAPHIGHAYTTVLADILTRYHRLAGAETFFLTGTDEHGQKVQQAAQKRGVDPKAHCDEYSLRFREAWQGLNISYDHFIRTTDREHIAFVRDRLQDLWDRGHVYVQDYEGWYSTSEERFFNEKELVNGKDPIAGRPVELVKEKNYFFRMSGFQTALIAHIEANPDFILPDFRRNEVLGFLRQPLGDLCISRPKSRLAWGIELPFDREYVAYVWVDALLNYASAVVGRTWSDGTPLWPCDFHLIGKDILTTHAVYWPTLLMGMGLPLPRHLLAHGWWLIDNAKMSKTTGNVVSPLALKDRYGVDAFRYFLAREMVVGQDASFSEDAFVARLNFDLANDLGNGLSRILKLSVTGLNGRITQVTGTTPEDTDLQILAGETVTQVLRKVAELKISQAVEEALQLARSVNRYLEQNMPWKLAKGGDAGLERLNAVLFHAAEALRLTFILLTPVMPGKMAEALAALGIDATVDPVIGSGTKDLVWGQGRYLHPMSASLHLFPRVEAAAKAEVVKPITITEPFAALDLRVARIVEVANHPQAEGLYILQLDVGSETRTVCAGLRKHLNPDQLLNQVGVVVANLKPAQLRGIESRGMLLATDNGAGGLQLIHPAGAKPGDAVTAQGLVSTPKPQITMKEFERAPLTVQKGLVTYAGKTLQWAETALSVQAPDGSEVR